MNDDLRMLVAKWRQQAKADTGYDSGAYFSGMSQGRNSCADDLERALDDILSRPRSEKQS